MSCSSPPFLLRKHTFQMIKTRNLNMFSRKPPKSLSRLLLSSHDWRPETTSQRKGAYRSNDRAQWWPSDLIKSTARQSSSRRAPCTPKTSSIPPHHSHRQGGIYRGGSDATNLLPRVLSTGGKPLLPRALKVVPSPGSGIRWSRWIHQA